jgi:glycosyltransferase involved in cell wall biosynthesis
MYPRVVAVCLTADRQDFTDRAVRCFRSQDYPNKHMVILCNGKEHYRVPQPFSSDVSVWRVRRASIGELRNQGAAIAGSGDIIIHWDSDDWSHPRRISCLVAALDIGYDIVGYNKVLFWDSQLREAWMYENSSPRYAVNATLAYRRAVWEQRPFTDISLAEGRSFIRDRERFLALPAFGHYADGSQPEPLIICEIHGANINDYDVARRPGVIGFTRVREWDEMAVRMIRS